MPNSRPLVHLLMEDFGWEEAGLEGVLVFIVGLLTWGKQRKL